MSEKVLDEQPKNAPILMTGRASRVRGSSPIHYRKLALRIRRHPRQAAGAHYFLNQPDGWCDVRRFNGRPGAGE